MAIESKGEKKEKKLFRLVLRDENTFEEVYSYRVHKGYLWIGLICLAIINILLTTGVIFAKPYIERWVKGDTESDLILALRQQVLDMEETIETQSFYLSQVQHLLAGDREQLAFDDSTIVPQIRDTMALVERIEEDEALRRAVALDEKLSIAGLQTSNIESASRRPINSTYFVSPVAGVVSLGFNPEEEHMGIDINAPKNTPIKVISDGHVIFAGWNLETGNTVGVQHSNNLISFYKHNSQLLCKTGDQLKAGEAIAIIGNTGTLSSGPHLHFELWLDGKPVDPIRYISFN